MSAPRRKGAGFSHGQEGRGRFKAFAIGGFAEWAVVYERDGALWSYAITMSAADIRHVNITDESPAPAYCVRGVTLTIAEPPKDFRTFANETGIHALVEIFALYLADYDDILLTVGGHRIDPSEAIASRKAINLADVIFDKKVYPARLEIVEWRGLSNRAPFLCNEKRFRFHGSTADSTSATSTSRHISNRPT